MAPGEPTEKQIREAFKLLDAYKRGELALSYGRGDTLNEYRPTFFEWMMKFF